MPVPIQFKYLAHCEQHLGVVAEWQQAEFGYLNPSITVDDRRIRLQEPLQSRALPLTIVAISEDGVAVGAATLASRTLTHAHLSPWLSTVVVPLQFRGHGIGSALSLRLAAQARNLGFETLYLFTPNNASLYQRIGWETIDVADINGLPVTVMSRSTIGLDGAACGPLT